MMDKTGGSRLVVPAEIFAARKNLSEAMNSSISRRTQAKHDHEEAATSPVAPALKHASSITPTGRSCPGSKARAESTQPQRQLSSPVTTETALSAICHATSPTDSRPMALLSPREDRAASSALPSETPLPVDKVVDLSARLGADTTHQRVRQPATPLSPPIRGQLKQSRRCESPAVTGAGDVLLPSSALPKPSTPAAAVHLLPTRYALPPEVDEEDEDEYTVMDVRWEQLTQGGPRVPIEVRHFDPPADALQPPSPPRKLSNTALASSHDVDSATSRSFAGDTGSQAPSAPGNVMTPLSSAASSPLSRLSRDTLDTPPPSPLPTSFSHPAAPSSSMSIPSSDHVAITINSGVEEEKIGTDLEEKSEAGLSICDAGSWVCASVWDYMVWGWQSIKGWWAGEEEHDTAASNEQQDMFDEV